MAALAVTTLAAAGANGMALWLLLAITTLYVAAAAAAAVVGLPGER